MAHRDIIVMGASAGGINAVNRVLAALPPDLEASLFVVLHLPAEGGAHLPEVLRRGNQWAIAYAIDGERIRHRRVYVAPPDHHLLVKPEQLRVVRGPRENRFRPAVDPLFRTAAENYRARVIGIVLSGALDDGTHGLDLIKRHGGLAVAQDPDEATARGMPLSAIQNVAVDHILRLSEMAARLPDLVAEPVEAPLGPRATGAIDVAEGAAYLRNGILSKFTCPECGGALRELQDGRVLRFRCHVGHGYTADSLLVDQRAGLDDAFWSALRALEEHSMLRRRMAEFALLSGRQREAKDHERDARNTERRASEIRRILYAERPAPVEPLPITAPAARRRRRRAGPPARQLRRADR